jgi:hypothetical protein
VPRHRRHVVLSVWPIALLFALGLAHVWPALAGAPSYASESPASWLSLAVATMTAFVFLSAYVRGWSDLAHAPHEPGPYRTSGCVRLQKIAGTGAWLLLLGWVALSWWMSFRVGPVALSHYELLRIVLSHPLAMGCCVFGLAALGLYLSQGLAASFRAWGLGREPQNSLMLEVACTVTVAVTMLIAINALSHFATGRAYWAPSASLAVELDDASDGRSP